MSKTSKMETRELANSYEPTPHERAVTEAFLARRKAKPLAPRTKVSVKGDVAEIGFDHPEVAVAKILLMEACGAKDLDFLHGLLDQLANAGTQGRKVDERGLNFMLSVVKSFEPKDQVEAMLAAQMAAVHMATMTFARRLAHVDNIPQQDSAERAFNKLARTFAAQMEALKRYRSGGPQQIVVKHITVNADQAVVTDQVVTGKPATDVVQACIQEITSRGVPSPALLTAGAEKPMPMLVEPIQHEPVTVRGGAKWK